MFRLRVGICTFSLEEPSSQCHVLHPTGWINTNNVCMLCRFAHWQLLQTGTQWDLDFIQVWGPYSHQCRLLYCTLSVMFWSRFKPPCQRTLPQLPNIFIYLLFLWDSDALLVFTPRLSPFCQAPCNHLCITPAHRVELISPVIIVIIDHRGRIGKVRQGFWPVCILKTDWV